MNGELLKSFGRFTDQIKIWSNLDGIDQLTWTSCK